MLRPLQKYFQHHSASLGRFVPHQIQFTESVEGYRVGPGGLQMTQGKIAMNLWCIRHNAVRVLTNQSTGRFVFHLALLPLVREPGDQARSSMPTLLQICSQVTSGETDGIQGRLETGQPNTVPVREYIYGQYTDNREYPQGSSKGEDERPRREDTTVTTRLVQRTLTRRVTETKSLCRKVCKNFRDLKIHQLSRN